MISLSAFPYSQEMLCKAQQKNTHAWDILWIKVRVRAQINSKEIIYVIIAPKVLSLARVNTNKLVTYHTLKLSSGNLFQNFLLVDISLHAIQTTESTCTWWALCIEWSTMNVESSIRLPVTLEFSAFFQTNLWSHWAQTWWLIPFTDSHFVILQRMTAVSWDLVVPAIHVYLQTSSLLDKAKTLWFNS